MFAKKFFLHYEALGWQIYDWRLKADEWAAGDEAKAKMASGEGSFDTNEFFEAAVAAAHRKGAS